MQNLASAADSKILLACADEQRRAILLKLAEEAATQKQLISEMQLDSSAISRHMKLLEEAELVIRDHSHGPYRLSAPTETWELLRASTNLVSAITKLRYEQVQVQGRRIQEVVMKPVNDLTSAEDGGTPTEHA